MKKLLFITIIVFLASCSFSFAQSPLDRYCQVHIGPNPKSFSSQRYTKISFGNHHELWALKDTSLFAKLSSVDTLVTEIDVLNYMTKMGWTMVSDHKEGMFSTIYFKKTFDRADIIEQ